MPNHIDYSSFDQPQILAFIFHPRQDWSTPPPGAIDYSVPVEEDVSISCRFYPLDESAPSILYFHGNGEVVYDYDEIAMLYNGIGVNLFVADYRGYGQSGGTPSFSNTASDAHGIFNFYRDTLRSSGYTGPLYIMGRSLGSFSAIELAWSYPQDWQGLIIESGFTNVGRLVNYLSFFPSPGLSEELENSSMERIRSITMPILIIHGDYDTVIPYEQALLLFQHVGSEDRRLLTIPGAGHNDLFMRGLNEYFSAIKDFTAR
ncbi:MAG: alpha/beta hydrolase [Chloroflexota bacterium]|nr:alpha/beta hydrolase [Chloroflexota bacterium]